MNDAARIELIKLDIDAESLLLEVHKREVRLAQRLLRIARTLMQVKNARLEDCHGHYQRITAQLSAYAERLVKLQGLLPALSQQQSGKTNLGRLRVSGQTEKLEAALRLQQTDMKTMLEELERDEQVLVAIRSAYVQSSSMDHLF